MTGKFICAEASCRRYDMAVDKDVAEIDWVTGKELYLGRDVYRVDLNGNLTWIASIWVCSLGFPNRYDIPEDLQLTYKKIK